MKALVFVVLLSLSTVASARPFRAMYTRTAETTRMVNLELGLRYQGFYAGLGTSALPYNQLSPTVRFGLFPNVELNLQVDFLHAPGSPLHLGDVPIGLQWTFVETRAIALGIWVRGTIPTGWGGNPRIPPSMSDGTLDGEGTFIAEVRPSTAFRIMVNLGYLHHGARDYDEGFGTRDVPEAVRADVAATLNLGEQLLLGVELMTRYYLDPAITPVWSNNALQIEAIPHLRYEIIPNLVLEAALGIAVSDELQQIYRVRGLLGFTYEFDFSSGDRGNKRGRR